MTSERRQEGIQFDMEETFVEEEMVPKVVLIDNLGANNDGKIGPNGLTDEAVSALIVDAEKPEYHGRATRRWVCVDGRGPGDDQDFAPTPEGFVDPQTAGSLVVTLSSSRLMTTDSPAPLSRTIAVTTNDIYKAGFQSVMHGDSHAGKSGCGANVNQRNTLERNAQNADIVAPVVWALAEATGLTAKTHLVEEEEKPLVTQVDLVDMLTQGGKNAAKDELWDATSEDVVDIAVANGAGYVEVAGDHTEAILAVTTDAGSVFNNRKFANEHTHPETGVEIEAFAAALGVLQAAIFEIVEKAGGTEHEAALLTLAAFCVNDGTAKILKNDRLLAAVFANA